MIKSNNILAQNWRSYKIPEVLWYQEGPGVRNTQFRDKGIKLLNVGNINDNLLDLSATRMYISEEEAYGKYKHFLVDAGDLIIASSGVVVNNFFNKITFVHQNNLPLCMNTSTIRFKEIDKNIISIKFFYYFLQTRIFTDQLRKLITGSAQLNFGPSHLKQISLPLPPFQQQQRIVKILDHADSIRRKNKQILKKYNELAQSVFYEMFGDPGKNQLNFPVGTIRDLVTEVKYGTSNKSSDKGKYPYLRMNNLTYDGNMNYSDMKYVDILEEEKIKYTVQNGDILFNRTNSKELVGKTAVFKSSKEMVIAGYLIRVRVNQRANPEYISAYLNSKHGKATLVGMCKSIIGMANINAQEMQNIKILIPPIDLQNRFAQIVEQIANQKAKTQNSIDKSEELFQSLMQRAFKGEL